MDLNSNYLIQHLQDIKTEVGFLSSGKVPFASAFVITSLNQTSLSDRYIYEGDCYFSMLAQMGVVYGLKFYLENDLISECTIYYEVKQTVTVYLGRVVFDSVMINGEEFNFNFNGYRIEK